MSFLFHKPVSRRIDLDKFNKCLDKLCDSPLPEPESTLRQGVFQNFEKISQLYAAGWTFEKICGFLRKELHVDFATDSLKRYYLEAKKERAGEILTEPVTGAGCKHAGTDKEQVEFCHSDPSMLFTKGMEALEELKKMGPPKNNTISLRQLVFDNYPMITATLDKGLTSMQIAKHLRKTLQIDFSDQTFLNYISQARKRAENQTTSGNI